MDIRIVVLSHEGDVLRVGISGAERRDIMDAVRNGPEFSLHHGGALAFSGSKFDFGQNGSLEVELTLTGRGTSEDVSREIRFQLGQIRQKQKTGAIA